MSSMTISVLLVEDNPIHARLLQGLLSDRSDPAFAVEAVDHLAAGIQRLSTGSFDAVLLDLVLPDSQEMATFERVKEAVPDMPVLVLTGLDDEGLAEEAVAAGAREYLVKTQIDGESLARSLQAAISK
ncbi:MAG: response regulator [Gemmatimonadetes bacterium]|jgi:glutamate dehydrogenase (NAD(P)+)|nr:response regulator [Gemmatimonadota bacterium]MDE0964996.1 response regulator [Candidatus Latescibacterota bacterium]MBT5329800.1 response regulator [Gemmatimonadota bacterium]MBT5452352.1 response regulator [Gemmatimonadota bacterium]MBT5801565.1 response regulator [Gemmatimonadota bacterium]